MSKKASDATVRRQWIHQATDRRARLAVAFLRAGGVSECRRPEAIADFVRDLDNQLIAGALLDCVGRREKQETA